MKILGIEINGYSKAIKNSVLDKQVNQVRKSFEGTDKISFNKVLNDSISYLLPKRGRDETDPIFNRLDKNKNGKLEAQELNSYMKEYYGISFEYMEKNKWTVEDLTSHLENVDCGKNKQDSINEIQKKVNKRLAKEEKRKHSETEKRKNAGKYFNENADGSTRWTGII